jgi:hypothetical protein
MAIYTDLPVYKKSYDLLFNYCRISKNIDRDYKYSLGSNAQEKIFSLILNIYRANMRADKMCYIESARDNVESIRLTFRVLHDLHQIALKDFVPLSVCLESVSKQLAGWGKHQNNDSGKDLFSDSRNC